MSTFIPWVMRAPTGETRRVWLDLESGCTTVPYAGADTDAFDAAAAAALGGRISLPAAKAMREADHLRGPATGMS